MPKVSLCEVGGEAMTPTRRLVLVLENAQGGQHRAEHEAACVKAGAAALPGGTRGAGGQAIIPT